MGDCEKLCRLVLLVVKLYHGESIGVDNVADYYPKTKKEMDIIDKCYEFCWKHNIESD